MEPILGNKSFYSRTERMLPVISTIWEIVVINQFNVRPRASPNCTPVRTVWAGLSPWRGGCRAPLCSPVVPSASQGISHILPEIFASHTDTISMYGNVGRDVLLRWKPANFSYRMRQFLWSKKMNMKIKPGDVFTFLLLLSPKHSV